MTNTRFFVFLYPEEPQIEALLNLAVYALNPDEKWPAHITLAGPYNSARNLPRRLEFPRKVSMLGVGQFRSSWQNTVFIAAGARDLRDFWDKPDYPFNPHLTLYDGEDAGLADQLYEAMSDIRLYFKFYVSRVHIVSAIKGQGSFELVAGVDLSVLPETRSMSLPDLANISNADRVLIASEALKRAKYVSQRVG